MPVIVEDGSIVNNANSYASELDLSTYANERGYTDISAKPEAELTTLLLKGMDYVESNNFKGSRVDYGQSLSFPRSDIKTGEYGEIANDSIPNNIKKALMQAAIEADSKDLFVIEQAQKKKTKVDVIETEYFEDKTQQPKLPVVDKLLNPFIKSRSFRTVRV